MVGRLLVAVEWSYWWQGGITMASSTVFWSYIVLPTE